MNKDMPAKIAFRICDYLNRHSARSENILDRDELRSKGILLPINENTPSSFYGKMNKRAFYIPKEIDNKSKLENYKITKIISEINRQNYFHVSEDVKKEYLVLERINQLHKIKNELPRSFRIAAVFIPYKMEMFVKNLEKEKEIKNYSQDFLVEKIIKNINSNVVSKELTEWDWCFRQMRDSFIGRSDDGWRKAYLRCKAGVEGKNLNSFLSNIIWLTLYPTLIMV